MGVALARDRVSFFFPAANGETRQFLTMRFVGRRSEVSTLSLGTTTKPHQLPHRSRCERDGELKYPHLARFDTTHSILESILCSMVTAVSLNTITLLPPGVDPRSIVCTTCRCPEYFDKCVGRFAGTSGELRIALEETRSISGHSLRQEVSRNEVLPSRFSCLVSRRALMIIAFPSLSIRRSRTRRGWPEVIATRWLELRLIVPVMCM